MSISIRELLDAGAHFGHKTHRWNPKMRPYIYGARNGIYIIDLQKTAEIWENSRQSVVDTIRRGQNLLFVGTKPQAQEVIEEEAQRGEQFFVNRRWLGGMLTNFKTIKSRLKRLEELETLKTTEKFEKLLKKEQIALEKERQKLERGLSGIRNMSHLPGMVVIVDPNKEHIAIREAKKLHIPILAITDTNCDPDDIDHMIPANDDALKSIRLFLHDIAEACLEGKREYELRLQEEAARKMEKEKEAKEQKEAAEASSETDENATPATDSNEPQVVRKESLAAGTTE